MDKLISANAVLEVLGCFTDREHGNPHFFNGLATAVEIIENAEEAVVRCKDCRHYWKNPDQSDAVCLASPRDDAYCSEGERREDGKTD